VERLATADPSAHAALVTVVVAGYYLHPEVQRRLGYPGQAGAVVPVGGYPDFVHEGQLGACSIAGRSTGRRRLPKAEMLAGDGARAGTVGLRA
jgi:hypothetical protein